MSYFPDIPGFKKAEVSATAKCQHCGEQWKKAREAYFDPYCEACRQVFKWIRENDTNFGA